MAAIFPENRPETRHQKSAIRPSAAVTAEMGGFSVIRRHHAENARRKRKVELSFFLNDRGRVAYNDLCRKCQRDVQAELPGGHVMDCPHYLSKRAKRKGEEDTD